MIALFFLVYTGSIGVLPDGISRVRSLNRGNPHTHLLLWYQRLPGRVNHPLGAIWVVNHSHKKLDINTVAMGSVCREATLIQSSPPSPPTLPLLPPWLPNTALQQSSPAWPGFTASLQAQGGGVAQPRPAKAEEEEGAEGGEDGRRWLRKGG